MAPAGVRFRTPAHPSNAAAARSAGPSRYSEGRPENVSPLAARLCRPRTPFADRPAIRLSARGGRVPENARVPACVRVVSIGAPLFQGCARFCDGPVVGGVFQYQFLLDANS